MDGWAFTNKVFYHYLKINIKFLWLLIGSVTSFYSISLQLAYTIFTVSYQFNNELLAVKNVTTVLLVIKTHAKHRCCTPLGVKKTKHFINILRLTEY